LFELLNEENEDSIETVAKKQKIQNYIEIIDLNDVQKKPDVPNIKPTVVSSKGYEKKKE